MLRAMSSNKKNSLRPRSETSVQTTTHTPKKILFYTSSEYGQANVILAVVHELLLLQKYEIHIVSFGSLKYRIKSLNKVAAIYESCFAVFHQVPGPSITDALEAKGEFLGPYPPGIKGALATYRTTFPAMATAWGESEYMAGYQACIGFLESINP
jgi:hypothetical protein